MINFKLFILVPLLLLTYVNARSQNQKLVDSLENEISELAKSKNDDQLVWQCYFPLFDEYALLNFDEKSEDAFQQCLKFAPNDSFKFVTYYRRLVHLSGKHNFKKTIDMATAIITNFPDNSEALATANMFMGVSHQNTRDDKNALIYFQKALDYASKANNEETYYMIKMNLANTLFDLGKRDSAMIYYKEGIVFYSDSTSNNFSQQTVSRLLNNVGTGYLGNNSDSAIKYLLLAKKIALEIKDPRFVALTSLNLGIEYYATGKPKKAENELRVCLKLLNDLDELFYHYEIYRLLAAIEYSNSNWELSMTLMDSSKYFSDLVRNEEREAEFVEAKTQFGLAEEELKNKLLEIENKDAEALIKWQWITGGLVLALLFGALAFVSFLKKQEKTINELNKNLKSKNDELDNLITDKDNLMGILFHDIRSPMAAIKTVADFVELDDDSKIDPNTMELLQEMKKVSEQGLKLVDNIWAIYELENKALDLVKLPVNIEEVFEEIAIEFEGMSSVKGIKFQINSINAETKTHKHLLVSVLRNLVSNGFKFSPSGSTVTLNAQENKNSIEIRIKDQGPGFSKDDQKKMFQKFQKLSAQPLHGEKSSGLGLYLVTLIANKIGAKIKLNKEYKSGAEFIFTVPKNNSI